MDKKYLFEESPVRKAVITLAIPTVISQLITVIYNIADTFFIGQLDDPVQVAAATVAMPPFIFLTGIANLFGIGGASLISRDLGGNHPERAKNVSAFAVWGGILTAFLYGMAFMVIRPVLLPLMGTTPETYELTYQYVFYTVTLGAVPTVLSTILAHLVRTEGYAKQASLGLTMGGILNIILDPLMIFGLHMQIQGAALATLLSNCAACIYFLVLMRKNRKNLCIRIHPRDFTLKKQIPREVLVVGLPSFVMTLMSFFSNVTLNQLVAGYSSEAVAGMGIAKKVDMVGFAVAQGMTQGVLALIGYNYAAGNRERMGKTIRIALFYSAGLALAGSSVSVCGAAVGNLHRQWGNHPIQSEIYPDLMSFPAPVFLHYDGSDGIPGYRKKTAAADFVPVQERRAGCALYAAVSFSGRGIRDCLGNPHRGCPHRPALCRPVLSLLEEIKKNHGIMRERLPGTG